MSAHAEIRRQRAAFIRTFGALPARLTVDPQTAFNLLSNGRAPAGIGDLHYMGMRFEVAPSDKTLIEVE